MSLLLDPRQRAMLREMGIAIWQPDAADPVGTQSAVPTADSAAAIKIVAVDARPARANWVKNAEKADTPVSSAGAGPAPLRSDAAVPHAAFASAAPPPLAPAGARVWQVGTPIALYRRQAAAADPLVDPLVNRVAVKAAPQAGPAHWLVLGETPAASLQAGEFDPLAGEAGLLLGNMLRAAGLPSAASVQFVALARMLPASPAQAGLTDALAPLLIQTRPDIVLVMGRLAAQAALGTDEPLGQLRGRVHRLHGLATVLTYDAAHLLRNPDNKAKAWDDLCLAIDLVRALPS